MTKPVEVLYGSLFETDFAGVYLFFRYLTFLWMKLPSIQNVAPRDLNFNRM